MDHPQVNHLELCAGYAGIGLGLKRVVRSLRTIAYCEIEAFAVANLVSKMEAGLLDPSPVWSNLKTFDFRKFHGLVDILSGGYPCFTAGTIVCTHRGFIPIEQVVVGDMALTHLGRWRRVTATMSKTGAPVRRIKAQGVPGVVCTDEHPFYTRDGWKEAKNLKRGDRIGQVLPEVVEDDRSPEFWWVIGRYLADGWRQKPPSQNCGRITICCNHKEADFLQEKIVAAGFHFCRSTDRTTTRFAIVKKELYEFCGQFGSRASGKHLPGWVLGLDPERAKSLCDGYFSGDGYRCKRGGNYWRVTTVSRGLAVSFALLAQRAFGVVATIREYESAKTKEIEGRTVNQRNQYFLIVPDRNRSGKVEGNYGWKYVRHNEPCGVADVYNIAVDEDESYYADGAIVHNCQPFSAAGKRKGKDDPRHLWPWIADGIRLCEPRLCLFENVEGHISLGLSTVVSDLEEMGYEVSWGVFSAAEVGAPHQRKRVFILASRGCWLANAERLGLERKRNLAGEQEVPEPAHIGAGDGGVLAHASHDGHAGGPGVRTDREGVVQAESGPCGGEAGRGSEPGGRGDRRLPNNSHATHWPSRPGQQQFWWEPPRVVGQTQSEDKGDMADSGGDGQHRSGEQEPGGVEGPRRGEPDGRGERGAAVKVGIHSREAEPPLGGDSHGGSGWLDHAELYLSCDNRTDELRLLGNGVVPATAETAFRVLIAEMWRKCLNRA